MSYTKEKNYKRTSVDSSVKLNRKMPTVVDLEQAVLGAIMLEKNAMLKVVSVLKPEYFYDSKNAEIFKAATELFRSSAPIDILTVTMKLRENGVLDSVGGAMHISELTNKINSSANIEFHARIIVEYFLRRALILIADEIEKKSLDETEDIFDTFSYSSKKITDAFNVSSDQKIKNAVDVYKETLTWLNDKKDAMEKMIVTGIKRIDYIIQELKPGEFSILGARPSMGKTTLAINYMMHMAYQQKKNVLFFSLEMTRIGVLQKFISNLTGLKVEDINPKSITENSLRKILDDCGIISTGKILIDDSPNRNILSIKAKAISAKMTDNIDCIFIDHFHMLQDKSTRYATQDQEYTYYSSVIKDLAKELNVHVVVLAQLNRGPENRTDKRPNVSDLRGTGSLEQDADIVHFIYRDDYYDKNNESVKGVTEIIVDKNRNGDTGFVNISHDLAKNKFW